MGRRTAPFNDGIVADLYGQVVLKFSLTEQLNIMASLKNLKSLVSLNDGVQIPGIIDIALVFNLSLTIALD